MNFIQVLIKGIGDNEYNGIFFFPHWKIHK